MELFLDWFWVELDLFLQFGSALPLAAPTHDATNVDVEELERVGQERAHLRGPHEEQRHAEDGVEHGGNPAPLSLGGDVSIP